MTVPTWDSQPPEVRQALNGRASNYAGTTGEDLYDKIPDHLKDHPQEILDYIEGREVGHLVSRANGGSDTPDNLEWMSPELNDEIGSSNITREQTLRMERENTQYAQRIENQYIDDQAYGTWDDGSPVPEPYDTVMVDDLVPMNDPTLINSTVSLSEQVANGMVVEVSEVGSIVMETVADVISAGVPVVYAGEATYQFDRVIASKLQNGKHRVVANATVGGLSYLAYTSVIGPTLMMGRLAYGLARLSWHMYTKSQHHGVKQLPPSR